MIYEGSRLLESLLKVSEKAANIARVCRQDSHLFELLVEEKTPDEKNPRFVQDFKTLADVLIQETIKHDIGNEVNSLNRLNFLDSLFFYYMYKKNVQCKHKHVIRCKNKVSFQI